MRFMRRSKVKPPVAAFGIFSCAVAYFERCKSSKLTSEYAKVFYVAISEIDKAVATVTDVSSDKACEFAESISASLNTVISGLAKGELPSEEHSAQLDKAVKSARLWAKRKAFIFVSTKNKAEQVIINSASETVRCAHSLSLMLDKIDFGIENIPKKCELCRSRIDELLNRKAELEEKYASLDKGTDTSDKLTEAMTERLRSEINSYIESCQANIDSVNEMIDKIRASEKFLESLRRLFCEAFTEGTPAFTVPRDVFLHIWTDVGMIVNVASREHIVAVREAIGDALDAYAEKN